MRSSFALPSRRLILSYVLDWVMILGIAAVGGGFNRVGPYHRPFSLLNLDISYPHTVKETIPVWLLIVVGMVVPGIIVLLVCLLFIPGPTANPRTPKTLIWRRKFWESNTGLMGLGLSLATAFLITEGMKNLFGKPRPDLLSRCNPDLSRIQEFTVGGYGQPLSDRWVLVSYGICQETDMNKLDDGFRSFPSGHSSFSWAGLLYLTLFLCAKFAVAIPFLPPRPYSQEKAYTALEEEQRFTLPAYTKHDRSLSLNKSTDTDTSTSPPIIPVRNQAAAPPVWTLVIALIPFAAAIYISSSRFSDFRHFGFDIISGSLIGIICAWFSFRWYHLPIRTGAGWSWGARTRDRAFGIGVGIAGYVGPEGWGSSRMRGDEEDGRWG
ncbi:hypothetical protein H2199_001634 [Coniosporium tulheliwenetii]|uniref:Uncharacterized protein n=1 Tax=Coniosporium tulheliwenetii TaxID=3383036 RepID=A0ACC2ZK18_9PEZI|nr:hypothetical protein H2199_001634 [Cladosporium sp. JES 115]